MRIRPNWFTAEPYNGPPLDQFDTAGHGGMLAWVEKGFLGLAGATAQERMNHTEMMNRFKRTFGENNE